MKKFLMMALVALTLCGSIFAKTYVIDLGDSKNGSTISIVKNPYAPNYQCELPADFTPYFAGITLAPGDKIEVHYNFTSNVDIEWMNIVIVDNSEKAKYWLELSDWKGLGNIKAGQPNKGVIEYKVVKKPIQNVTVMFSYDKALNAKLTLAKAGQKTGSSK